MSKEKYSYKELSERRQKVQDEFEDIVSKYQTEINDIDEEIEKLKTECQRKIERKFRGIIVEVDVEPNELMISVGEEIEVVPFNRYSSSKLVEMIPFNSHSSSEIVLQYSPNLYEVNTQLISDTLAKKIKDIYIDYFGQL